MSLSTTLALIFTILTSVIVVASIILLGWFLIWKAFLSKFRLVRELLGQGNDDEQAAAAGAAGGADAQNHADRTKTKKQRKD